MSDGANNAAWGRIGGLIAHALNGSDRMLEGARAGFRERFRREVLAVATERGEELTEAEIAARAHRLMTAHMLRLAAKSAEARRAMAARGAR